MSKYNQEKLDFLYENICASKVRLDTINQIKTPGERKVLEKFAELYKAYYKHMIMELRKKLEKIKECKVNSYLTRDVEYYVNEFTKRTEIIDKYLVVLENIKCEDLVEKDLSIISTELDYEFPKYLLKPTNLGKLI